MIVIHIAYEILLIISEVFKIVNYIKEHTVRPGQSQEK